MCAPQRERQRERERERENQTDRQTESRERAEGGLGGVLGGTSYLTGACTALFGVRANISGRDDGVRRLLLTRRQLASLTLRLDFRLGGALLNAVGEWSLTRLAWLLVGKFGGI
jgi:hypothetical protein